jgi:hypothetical protein
MPRNALGSYVLGALCLVAAAAPAVAQTVTPLDEATYLYYQNVARSLSLIEEIAAGETQAAEVQAALQVEILQINRGLYNRHALSAQDLDIAVATEAVARQRALSLAARAEAQAANSAFNAAIGDMFLSRTVDLQQLTVKLRSQWEAQCRDVAATRATRLAELTLAGATLRRDENLYERQAISREEILTARAEVAAADAKFRALDNLDSHCMEDLPALPVGAGGAGGAGGEGRGEAPAPP